MILKNRIRISEKELELLEVIHNLGPCSSEKVHETLDSKNEYLLVMRRLHILADKGFLQRIAVNKKLLYRTPRKYANIRTFLIGHNY